METKLIEVRDRATFIVAVAVRMQSDVSRDAYLLRRSGYGPGSSMVLLARADGHGPACYDPYSWGDRTMMAAHHHVERNWSSIASGDVVDVEFLLGETGAAKEPEGRDA